MPDMKKETLENDPVLAKVEAYLKSIGYKPERITELLESIQKDTEFLKSHAAKTDDRFEGVETRLNDLEKGHSEMIRRFFALEDKMEANQEALNQKFDRLFTILDSVAKDIQDLKTEKIAATARLDRHDKQLIDHDKRIGRLETVQAA